MTADRLQPLHLLPPRSQGVWAVNPVHPPESKIRRPDSERVNVTLPLFWYEPPWIELPTEYACALAASVANLDVVVAALRRDVADDDQPSAFFQPIPPDDDEADDRPASPPEYLPRMTAYRPERYGLAPSDFDHCRIVDVRLYASRDGSGRFAYSPEQMDRWERPAEESWISGGGYVATSTFPADVTSLKQAGVKLDQLRRLAPTAAVFVSIEPYRLEEEVAAALVSHPDGLILRLDRPELEGIQLAAIVHRARAVLGERGKPDLPLWIVPGQISVRDVAKLYALGATAVAIDSWCEPIVRELRDSESFSRVDVTTISQIPALASEYLWHDIDHVIGLLSAIDSSLPVEQLLGTYHARWAKACGASMLTA